MRRPRFTSWHPEALRDSHWLRGGLVTLFILALWTSVAAQTILSINGAKLFVHKKGSGNEPLLIVHGGPGLNHTYFLPHLDKLAEKFTLIYYDQRASGLSSTPSTDSITLKMFVEDIESIRKTLKIRSINIFAHSWGIVPALLYTKAHPERVKRLILCNPVPLSRDYDEEIRTEQKILFVRQDSLDRATIMQSDAFKAGKIEAYEQLMTLAFRHSFYEPSNLSKLKIDLPANYPQASRALFTGLGKELSANLYDSLNNIRPHVMLLLGAHDILPADAVDQFNKRIPSVRFVFEESGHFIFIEEPELFRKRVETFLLRN